jgi:hypothetical protein
MAKEREKAARRERELREQERAEQALEDERAQAAPTESPGGAKSDLPAGVRDLGKAFTRAIPYATNADPIWEELPLGTVGTLKLRITLTDGRITKSEVHGSAPLALEHLRKRTIALLEAGRFALPMTETQGGTQELEISVRLRRVTAPSSLKLGFEPPQGDRPGEAYFVLGNGLRLDATVRVSRRIL